MKFNIILQYSEEKQEDGSIEQDVLLLMPKYSTKFGRKNIISKGILEYEESGLVEHERNYIISTTINEALSNIIKTFNN